MTRTAKPADTALVADWIAVSLMVRSAVTSRSNLKSAYEAVAAEGR
jgi:hypothetical protein